MGVKDLGKLDRENKKKVLVIDDDEISLEIVGAALKSNYDVRLVSVASESLAIAQEYFPDVIILDLNMPNVDGYEILSQFKSHPFLSSIPILCLSGDKSIDARRQTRELGAAGFIVKPVKKSQLQSDIELILKSSNIKIVSADQRRSFFIAYNSNEKEKEIHEDIARSLKSGSRVILISLASGVSFCREEEIQALDEDRFVYLQFKGNILSKLPFMEDLSPIIYDLEEIIGSGAKDYELFVDDPDILLNIYESSSSRGQVYLFGELLGRNFKDIYYYSRKPADRLLADKLNQLAGILTGKN